MTTKQTQSNQEKNVDQKWDEILATKESQDMLDKMASDALKEFNLGECKPMFDTEK